MVDFSRSGPEPTLGDTVMADPAAAPRQVQAGDGPRRPGRRRRAKDKAPGSGLGRAPRKPRVKGGLKARVRATSTRLWVWSEPYRATARPWLRRVGAVLGLVSGLGWLVLAAAVVGIVLGANLGWREFSYMGAALFIAFVLACLFVLGKAHLDVTLQLAPQRVVQGEAAAAQVLIKNTGRARLLPIGIELPIGDQAARFSPPTLAPGESFEDMVVIPTIRRGVVPVGPISTQRGDPFGVVRREVVWTDREDLFVHPVTVPLDALGAGLLRDLEGRTTQDLSMSDLAFHTLRDYVPGDDRRYIHWRSSAKLAGVGGEDRFLVRQFLDTRRSHIGVVTDVAQASYASEAEFELALSVGASIAVRALTDEMDLTVVCGEHVAVQPPPHTALDTYSRAEAGDWTLARATGQMTRLAPDVSIVLLVTGSASAFAEVQHARTYLPPEVGTVVIMVDEGGQVALRDTAGVTMVTLGALAELPRVMAGGQVV